MSSPGFKADAAAMAQAVQGFDECSVNAKQAMTDLENTLTSLLSQYQGDQAVAFWNLHSDLQDKMTLASRELDTMSQLVNQSQQNYGAGDSQSAQSIKTLSSSVSAGGSVLSRLNNI